MKKVVYADIVLKRRIRALLKVAKMLRKRKLAFKIIGVDLIPFRTDILRRGSGGFLFYKTIIVRPYRSPYYIYKITSKDPEDVYCPLFGYFCDCSKESEECFKEAQKRNRIKLNVRELFRQLWEYSGKLLIRVERHNDLNEEVKEWLKELGFINGEMLYF